MANRQTETVAAPTVDIEQLSKELTNKNTEYIFSLKRRLRELGQTDEQIAVVLTEILPVIVDNQKRGYTARKLYGTVSEYTAGLNDIKVANAKAATAENTTPWLMWLDNTLLLLGVLAIVNGLMNLLSKPSQNANQGIITLILMASAGGLVFYLMYHYFYRSEAKKEGIGDWIKTIVIIAAAILGWVLLLSLSALLPTSLNPVLPPVAILIVGGLGLLLRWYLKRKYNIANAMVKK